MLRGNLEAIRNGDGTINVVGNCVFCGKSYKVTVDEKGFDEWESGEPIQYALPKVSVDDKDFLISGISPEGWKETFG